MQKIKIKDVKLNARASAFTLITKYGTSSFGFKHEGQVRASFRKLSEQLPHLKCIWYSNQFDAVEFKGRYMYGTPRELEVDGQVINVVD